MMDPQVTGAIKFMLFIKIPDILLFNNLGNNFTLCSFVSLLWKQKGLQKSILSTECLFNSLCNIFFFAPFIQRINTDIGMQI
jgi:hypothetical protein